MCPDTTLVMTDRQGIEIDYCPQCRGVWLDRGELDKIVERGVQSVSQNPTLQPRQTYPQDQPQVQSRALRQPDFEDSDFRRHGQYGHRKQKSWLSEIFD
jgi:Zn-finger nucleic acid-binding protein